ncbi:MAG: PKD-like domain-containing protein, partial [Bacteroidota bacterium]|nr:PKD-like domain-containing protein [Bacteroidota bacterium]
ANGCTNTSTFNVVVTVYPAPVLSSSLTPPTICSGNVFSYVPASATPSVAFAWTRALVTGISNISNSGTGNPNETLTNTTANPVNVTYVYTLSANGCTNPTTFSVVVTVTPAPTLSSTLTPPAICSTTLFNYAPTSSTPGATFAWTRAAVPGISEPAGFGNGDPNEVLTNTTGAPINVTYVYTVSINLCTNPTTYNVVVSVILAPTLNSSLSPPTICTGSLFSYAPTTATPPASFAWTRAAVAGISEIAGSGTGNPNEILTNTTTSPINVTYLYTVSANGCVNSTAYSVVVTVSPKPTLSSSLSPPAVVCGAPFNYTPTSATGGAAFSWTRAVVAGISNIAGSGTNDPNETLTNTTENPINVTYIYSVSANGCTNPTTFSVVVAVNPTPALYSSLSPPAFCSGTAFSYTPTSATIGATFTWTRAVVPGVSNTAGAGTNNPNEILTNTVSVPVNVKYIYNVSANGCTNATNFNVIVPVNPNPTLNSTATPPGICSGTVFS